MMRVESLDRVTGPIPPPHRIPPRASRSSANSAATISINMRSPFEYGIHRERGFQCFGIREPVNITF